MAVRGRTLQIHRLTKNEARILALLYPERNFWRPTRREDCGSFGRPCPYAGCRYHLYLDVGDKGNIRLNYPETEIWDLEETCALDIASRGGLTLEDTGEVMSLTRERVRQIEMVALGNLRQNPEAREIVQQIDSASREDYASFGHGQESEAVDFCCSPHVVQAPKIGE